MWHDRGVDSDASLIAELRAITDVLDDHDLTERYRRDWTGRFVADDAVVVRPADVAEVAEVVSWCAERGAAIVPQGGNTGLVGGSVPRSGEIVLSTERLVGIESVDGSTGHLTAQSGTPLAEVQRAAQRAGWAYGVDIASRDSATIGGTVATNAGGLHVIRYGATRAQVVGVALVTGTGDVIDIPSTTLRDNTGYHLPGIVCGSEGTLGVVTAVRVRLVPEWSHRTTALVRFAEETDAAVAVEAVRGLLPSVESAEVFFASGLELVCSTFSLPHPFSDVSGGYVLVEVADTDDATDALGTAVASLTGVADVAVATDSAGRAGLWRYRERHTDAIATIGTPHKLDVAVPPGSLAEFVDRVNDVVAEIDPSAAVWLFGHGGEAAMHVNVTGPAGDDDTVDDAVLGLVADMGGSISAEHGIGTAKVDFLERLRDPAENALRRRIKAAFDPHGIMNPSVLVPPR